MDLLYLFPVNQGVRVSGMDGVVSQGLYYELAVGLKVVALVVRFSDRGTVMLGFCSWSSVIIMTPAIRGWTTRTVLEV